MRRALLLAALGGALLTAGAATPAQAAEPGIVIPGGGAAGSERNVEAVIKSGAKWARVFLFWASLEPSSGRFDPGVLTAYRNMAARFTRAGVKFNLVVTGSPQWASGSADINAPPRDPAAYASMASRLASELKGLVALYEVWNEMDEDRFWRGGPEPARYAALLRAAYPAFKAADPAAAVIIGGLTGGNYQFVEQVYAAGAKGLFDGVAVHTDTACQLDPPSYFYRQFGPRIGRITFLGYREVRASMLANGDDKPIYLTEIGWSTSAVKCDSGAGAGKKNGGVAPERAAEYLREAFHCLAEDKYVVQANWFNLFDEGEDRPEYRYGLYDTGFRAKPALAAFQSVARNGDTLTGPCGDFGPPRIVVDAPAAEGSWAGELPIEVSATDGEGVGRITLSMDGHRIRNFTDQAFPGRLAGQIVWQGAKKLPDGPHTMSIEAVDRAGNVGKATVRLRKVPAGQLPPVATRTNLTVTRGRSFSASVEPARRVRRVPGKLRLTIEKRSRGRWRVAKKYTKPAKARLRVSVRMGRGRYRARAQYFPLKPFRGSRSTTVTFAVR